MQYVISFITGGLICAAIQILMEKTMLLPGRIMVILVITGCVLGFFGIYEPFAKWAGCGATVPLCGFGYRLFDGVKTAVSKEGFIGLFSGGIKDCAVGISAALIFSYLASLIFEPKMKK